MLELRPSGEHYNKALHGPADSPIAQLAGRQLPWQGSGLNPVKALPGRSGASLYLRCRDRQRAARAAIRPAVRF
jgi:hypothetical protein